MLFFCGMRRFQPIPVQTMPVEDDVVLKPYANCPEYVRIRQEVVEQVRAVVSLLAVL